VFRHTQERACAVCVREMVVCVGECVSVCGSLFDARQQKVPHVQRDGPFFKFQIPWHAARVFLAGISLA